MNLDLSPRTLKTLIRCWIPAWIGFLMIAIHPALQTIGLASFFCVLSQMFCPPNTVGMVFIFTALSLWLGMLSAWAWGVIVMKAAQAARPAAETTAQLMRLEQLAEQQANKTGLPVTTEIEVLVFQGGMLDARVSAVFMVLGLLFIYFLALLRMKNPKFMFTQLLGMIITDVFMTYGPLMPDFNGTLPKIIVLPATIGLALALFSVLVIFPQSTSHVTLEMTEKILDGMKKTLTTIIESHPESEAEEQQELAALNATKQGLLGQLEALLPMLGFLKLDYSFGRWSDKDITSLEEKLRSAFMGFMNLVNLRMTRYRHTLQAQKALALSSSTANASSVTSEPISEEVGDEDENDYEIQEEEEEEEKEEEEKNANKSANSTAEEQLKQKTKRDKQIQKRSVGLHQITEFSNFLKAVNDADTVEIRNETFEMLRNDSSEILQTSIEALDSIQECIHAVNTSRIFKKLSQETYDAHVKRSESVLEKLRAIRIAFVEKTTDDLLNANAELFDANGKIKTLDNHLRNRFRAVMMGMTFEEHILGTVDGIIPLLEKTLALYTERTKNRMWFPAGIRHTASWIFQQSEKAPVTSSNPFDNPDDVIIDLSDLLQQKLGAARGIRKRPRSKLARFIGAFWHFMVSPDSLYALRVVVVSIVLAIPAVIPQSAAFYYDQRGLWALIMGQTTMLAYMADFTFSVVMRIIGTVVGGVLGLVAWYIGSGNGSGNPYGLAASVGVFLVPIVYARAFLPRVFLLSVMMGAATFLLVVGYGYDYAHIASISLPGYGYEIFWRRLVLVLVGMAASIIVQILPRPVSATRHISRSLSKSIRTLCDHYALLLSSLGEPNTPGLQAVMSRISIQQAQALGSLDLLTKLVKFEFSTSLFDSASLGKVKQLCIEINYSLARLLSITCSLSVEYQQLLSRQVGMRSHHSIGDVMAVLGVVEQSLKSGDALPEVLPTPLLKRCFDHWVQSDVELIMSLDKVKDTEYRKFCAAVSSYMAFLGAVDDLVLVMKEAVGEAHIVSTDLLHQL